MKKLFWGMCICMMAVIGIMPLTAEAKVNIEEVDAADAVVSEDTIYDLNEQYLEGTIEHNAASFLQSHAVRIIGNMYEPLVEIDGYADWSCEYFAEGSSAALDPIRLKYRFTGEEFTLKGEKEDLEAYFERTAQISREIREKADYIMENLSESEYGGLYYQEETGKVCVYLVNGDRQEELEERGYQCVKTERSVEKLSEKLCELWNNRNENGINYIKMNYCENRLDIYAVNPEWIPESPEYQVIDGYVIHPGNCFFPVQPEQVEQDVIMDIFDGVAFPGSVEEDLEENEIYNKILIGVLKLQTAYPEYDMRNLLNRIASDGNYERYLDFESEITEFVENLPEYKANENNPAEEMMFGDPQRIELKVCFVSIRHYILI